MDCVGGWDVRGNGVESVFGRSGSGPDKENQSTLPCGHLSSLHLPKRIP